MGDFRFNAEIQIIGVDGKKRKIEWWLNWTPDMPERLYREMVKVSIESGLDVEDKTHVFDEV